MRGGHDGHGHGGVALPGQNVENDVGRMHALAQSLGASRFHRRKPIAEYGGQNRDHLPTAIIAAGELAPDLFDADGQYPILEGRAITQGARFARQHRDIMPGIKECLLAAKRAGMLAHDHAVLAQLDVVGIGADLDRAPNCIGHDRVLVVAEPDEARLGDRGGHGMEAVKAADIGHKAGTLGLEGLLDRLVPDLGMAVRPGIGNGLVQQPGVHLVIALKAQARREKPFAHQTNLVLDLTLFPARSPRAGDGVNQVMAAHLRKPAIVGPLLAHKDRLHRRLHVIVDAAGARALEEREGSSTGIEHLSPGSRGGRPVRTACGYGTAGHGRP